MDTSRVFAQMLRAPPATLSTLFLRQSFNAVAVRRTSHLLSHQHQHQHRQLSTSSLPRILQPSFWSFVIPRSLRRRLPGYVEPAPAPSRSSSASRPGFLSNPATPFILLGLFTGSQAIQLLVLKNETANFARKADAKIALLREIIERVKRGENVDVEGMLGVGDENKEIEWEEVLRELEEQERIEKRKAKIQAVAQKRQEVTGPEGSEDEPETISGPPRYL